MTKSQKTTIPLTEKLSNSHYQPSKAEMEQLYDIYARNSG